tara:strand:- start:83 stop:1165 length:1083 start_codon:yes stop_codon:yes gene_type:complete
MTTNSILSDRITQLDGLRGIAAVMVLALHFPITDSFFTNNFFVRQSWLFVDFFFVLSGFIIATNYYTKINTWSIFKTYIIKRVARLLPLLYFTVIVYFAYEMVGLFLKLKIDPQSISYYTLQTIDSLSFLNSTPILGDSQGMNPPSWSISAEMISYIVFALGMIIFSRKKIYFSILVVTLCIFFMIINNNFAFQNGDYGYLRGLLGFNLGVITYKLSKSINFKTNFLEIPVVLLTLITFYLTFNYKGYLQNTQYIVFPFIFSAVVFVFRFSSGLISNVLNSRFLQMLGKLSYSIYLNHYLLLIIIYQISFNLLGIKMSEFNVSLIFFISIIIVILFSMITYNFIEMRIGKKLKNILIEKF